MSYVYLLNYVYFLIFLYSANKFIISLKQKREGVKA